jgi:hypothetical protein
VEEEEGVEVVDVVEVLGVFVQGLDLVVEFVQELALVDPLRFGQQVHVLRHVLVDLVHPVAQDGARLL